MDASRFDAIARSLARPASRRSLALLIAASTGGALAADAEARAPGLGKPCRRGQRCRAGTCRRRVCSCGDGERACADACIAAEACCDALGERRCPGSAACLSRDACCIDTDCPDRPTGSPCLRFGCRGDRTCGEFPAPAGTLCGDEDQSTCDGAGNCVRAGCRVDADCAGHDDFCLRSSCVLGRCQADPRADGTPLPGQADGDCRAVACDGAGGRITVPDNADLPANDDPCVAVSCDAGTAVRTAMPAGTPCDDGTCDGRGRCA